MNVLDERPSRTRKDAAAMWILRPGERFGSKVMAVILGDAIAVPCHYDAKDGTFPCLAHQCRYAVDGLCNRPAPVRHFAPAQVCVEEPGVASAAACQAYAEAFKAWCADRTRPRPVDPNLNPPSRIVPAMPKTRSRGLAANALPAIAEILDGYIDEFPTPLRGVVYTLTYEAKRRVYRGWIPTEPVHPILPGFPVVGELQRLFAMPIYPDGAPSEEKPDTIPFQARRQA